MHTFDRRLLSSCGWSLTTSPSCWAAAFLVTGVVPVSSRINRRSSLKTGLQKPADKVNRNVTDDAEHTASNQQLPGSFPLTLNAVLFKDHI